MSNERRKDDYKFVRSVLNSGIRVWEREMPYTSPSGVCGRNPAAGNIISVEIPYNRS